MTKCLFCNQPITVKYAHEKYCYIDCKQRHSIKRANDEWASRDSHKPDLYINKSLGKSHVSNRSSGWMRNFNACRG